MHEGNIAYKQSTHPNDREVIDKLTAPRYWDSEQFNKVMVALGIVGNGQSLSSINCPESIHLQKLRGVLDELLTRTQKNGREHARTMFIDTETKKLVLSEKISVGGEHSVSLHTKPQPGREEFQKLIGTAHTHPGGGLAAGLSSGDYYDFIDDIRQQFMILAFGENTRILVLKTSVTPNNLSRNTIAKRIADIKKEFFGAENAATLISLIDLNKTICTEFGLIFFMANKESNDLFERIKVVDLEN